MQPLTTLFRHAGLNIHGSLAQRTAVRAVVLRGKDILLVHSPEVGDYKFPGGGVNPGETHEQALRREVREECGMILAELGDQIGAVVEYSASIDPQFDAFQMTSYYYACTVGAIPVGAIHREASPRDELPLQLDDYEQALHFEPAWINIDKAIWLNKQVLRFGKAPGWLRRELFVLEYIRRDLPRGPIS